MKNIYLKYSIRTIFICFAIAIIGNNNIFAQAPNSIFYQGVARNASGNLIASQSISLRFSIIDTSPAGTTLYQETQTTTTSALGLFSVNIGTGTVVSGTMASITWGTNNKYLKVELDPTGGSTYTDMGTQQLLSVPYALFANSSNNGLLSVPNNYLVKSNGTAGVSSSIIDDGTGIGIGVATPTEKLEIGGSTTASIKASGLASNSTITTNASDVMVMTDANGVLRRANETIRDAWYSNGNNFSEVRSLGTTNAQPFILMTNNVERARILSTTGRFVVGATASPYPGEMFTGVATNANPFAVNGHSSHNGPGVSGQVLAASATGFSATQGVYGGSGSGAGVLGNYNGTNTSATRAGVYGVVSGPAAANGGAGVYGRNSVASGSQRIGVLGSYNTSAFGIGVYGLGKGGVIMTGNVDAAVVGWRADNQNYSGYFNGNHVVANGTKSASVATSKGNQLLYAAESPEVWFEDYGTATLKNGEVEVQLDPLFLETVAIDANHKMHVFIQMEDDSKGVFVKTGTTSFKVKERAGGTSNASFSYKVIAKRLNFQDHRFGNDPVWQGGDTRKYSQYAPPPPIDYEENLKFQKQQAQNARARKAVLPPGFIDPSAEPMPALKREN